MPSALPKLLNFLKSILSVTGSLQLATTLSPQSFSLLISHMTCTSTVYYPFSHFLMPSCLKNLHLLHHKTSNVSYLQSYWSTWLRVPYLILLVLLTLHFFLMWETSYKICIQVFLWTNNHNQSYACQRWHIEGFFHPSFPSNY